MRTVRARRSVLRDGKRRARLVMKAPGRALTTYQEVAGMDSRSTFN